MSRFSLSFNDSYRRPTMADRYGRRIRRVEGVHIVGEDLLLPLLLKVALALALLGTVTTSVAAWRLFTFPH